MIELNAVITCSQCGFAKTVVATEYKLEPALVTAIVFLGTALSPLTLTPLIVYLAR